MNVPVAIAEKVTPLRRRNSHGKALNLALQGMGAHAAFGWGILDRLLEDGRIDVTGIAATSSGALNAVVYAYAAMKGDKEHARAALESFWRKVSDRTGWMAPLHWSPFGLLAAAAEPLSIRWFELLTHFFSPYEFNPLNLHPLRTVLESEVDFGELSRGLGMQLAVSATVVKTGLPRVFINRQISCEAVLASSCQPTLTQAVEIDGEYYWDGAYSGSSALAPLLASSRSRDLLVGQISPIERRDFPRHASAIHARIGEIALHGSLLRDAQALGQAGRLIDPSWLLPEHRDKFPVLYVHAIRSDEVLSDLTFPSKFDVAWRSLTMLRDRGRLAAELWLETNFDKIGVCSTADVPAEPAFSIRRVPSSPKQQQGDGHEIQALYRLGA